MPTPSVCIALNNVSIRYGRTEAVRAVSGTFAEGSLVALAGPNGAGKSTLLKAIAGILKPASGHIDIAHEAEHHTAFLPQSSALQRDYPFTVLQTALTGLWPELGSGGAITEAHKTRARSVLAKLGLEDLEKRQIGALSGGQFQRLLFARVMMQDPKLILLDEPFTGLDNETTKTLVQILRLWHKEGRTVLCVLHDFLLLRRVFPETFLMDGALVASGPTEELFRKNLLTLDLGDDAA